ncbi:MAG: BON domain-containing protein [Saccharospirillum sp.]
MIRILAVLSTLLVLSGCASVFSRATGNQPIEPNPEGRSVGQVIDDNTLATRIRINLAAADEAFEQARVEVHAHAGVVLMVGQVPSPPMVAMATEVARNDPQVRAVHNHLEAKDPISMTMRTNDSWLAVKVRSRMFTTDDFPSSRVTVIVEEGVVYLMGRVSDQTAQDAVRIAGEVTGVQKIVTVFTPIAS